MRKLLHCLFLVLISTAAFTQQTTQTKPASASQPGSLSETVEVRVVNVDVVVTDKKGKVITDLSKEDFRLMEDGREVAISNFAFYRTTPSQTEDRTSSPTSADPTSTVSTTPTQPLTIAVYLDSRNTLPQERQRVLKDLRSFLNQAHSSTQWILASFNNRLEIHAGPTANASTLLEALPADQKRSSKGLSSLTEERAAYSQILDSYQACEGRPGGPAARRCIQCDDNWGEMLSFARTHAIAEETRAATALSGLADLVGALSGFEGRKAVLYVGGGFHQRGGQATFGYLADLCSTERPQTQNEVFRAILEYDSTTRMQQVAAYANGNRVTLYMLDAGGVRSGLRGGVDFASTKFAPSADNDRMRTENIQGAHFTIANETGGTAILNANRPLEALVKLDETLNAGSYSLGFQPDHPPTGRSHQLKVELVDKAAKRRTVRYRHSYQDKQLQAKLVDKLVSGLFLELSQNPLNVAVSVGTPQLIKKKLYELPITVTLDRIAFLNLPKPEPNRDLLDSSVQTGLARIWLSAISSRGDRSEIRQQFLSILPASGEQEATKSLVVNMPLVPGSYDIAVGVRDESSHEVSVVRVKAEVEAPSN